MSYKLWVAQQIDYQLFKEKYPLSILHKKAVPLTNETAFFMENLFLFEISRLWKTVIVEKKII